MKAHRINVLLVRESESEPWRVRAASRDLSTVVLEQQNCRHDNVPRRNLRIYEINDGPAAIEAALSRINASRRAA